MGVEAASWRQILYDAGRWTPWASDQLRSTVIAVADRFKDAESRNVGLRFATTVTVFPAITFPGMTV
jgi:hypothetical protein